VAVQRRHRRQGAGTPDDPGPEGGGGDRLGKTIIFAKNNDHADFIAERFNKSTTRTTRATSRAW
jgi:hypothetical protein